VTAQRKQPPKTGTLPNGQEADAPPPILAAALDYAARGWPVFPLHGIRADGACTCGRPECAEDRTKRGKHPRTRRGVKDASTCPETIRDWWAKWPEANVGIATGGELMVLDVDGPEGERSLSGRHLPPTPSVTTGRGCHYYFRPPEGVTIGNATRFLPGLDVRGEGGYAVAPPSRHFSGVDYAWQITLDEEEVAPCPGWLPDVCARRPRATAAAPAEQLPGATVTEGEERIPEGRRNAYFLRYGGQLRAAGSTLPEVTEALLLVNRTRCDPPEDEGKVCRLARWVCGHPRGEVRVDRCLLTAGLSDGALALAYVIAAGADEEELMRVLCVTDRTLRRWWAELREAGLEEVTRAIPTRRFVTVPRGLLLDPDIPRAAKVTSLHLASYERNGRMKVSQEQLGRKRDRDPREVKRDLRTLRRAGYLCCTGLAAFCGAKGRREEINSYWWPAAELQNVASEMARGWPPEASEAKSRTPRPPGHAQNMDTDMPREAPAEASEAKSRTPRPPGDKTARGHHDPITTEVVWEGGAEEVEGAVVPLLVSESESSTQAAYAVDRAASVPARPDEVRPPPDRDPVADEVDLRALCRTTGLRLDEAAKLVARHGLQAVCELYEAEVR